MKADYATNLRPRISGMPCLCVFPDFIAYSYSIDDTVSCALMFLLDYILYSNPDYSGHSLVSSLKMRPECDRTTSYVFTYMPLHPAQTPV